MFLLVDMVDFFRKLNFVCDCSYIEYADANRGAAVSFIGGAAVSAAPTKLLVHFLVGALLALASGKAERRQVHPLRILSCGCLLQFT